MGAIEDSGRVTTGRRRFMGLAAGAAMAAQIGLPGRASAGSAPQPVAGVRPFRIRIPQRDLVDLRRRVQATRWPDVETVGDRSQGAQLAKLRPLVEYWGHRL
jgi:hypothetical protein